MQDLGGAQRGEVTYPASHSKSELGPNRQLSVAAGAEHRGHSLENAMWPGSCRSFQSPKELLGNPDSAAHQLCGLGG